MKTSEIFRRSFQRRLIDCRTRIQSLWLCDRRPNRQIEFNFCPTVVSRIIGISLDCSKRSSADGAPPPCPAIRKSGRARAPVCPVMPAPLLVGMRRCSSRQLSCLAPITWSMKQPLRVSHNKQRSSFQCCSAWSSTTFSEMPTHFCKIR